MRLWTFGVQVPTILGIPWRYVIHIFAINSRYFLGISWLHDIYQLIIATWHLNSWTSNGRKITFPISCNTIFCKCTRHYTLFLKFICSYWRFGVWQYLHIHGWVVVAVISIITCNLQKKALRFFEAVVTIYQSIRCNIPEDFQFKRNVFSVTDFPNARISFYAPALVKYYVWWKGQ